MAISHSEATWNGTLKEGSGSMKVASGYFEGPYTYATRFEGGANGTNPEELIGAAHAGCYSMFLSALLTNNGYNCLLYTSPSPRDRTRSRMPSSA